MRESNTNPVLQLQVLLTTGEGGEGLDDDEHVVYTDTQEKERKNSVSCAIEESNSWANSVTIGTNSLIIYPLIG